MIVLPVEGLHKGQGVLQQNGVSDVTQLRVVEGAEGVGDEGAGGGKGAGDQLGSQATQPAQHSALQRCTPLRHLGAQRPLLPQ